MILKKLLFVFLVVSSVSVAGPRNLLTPRYKRQSLYRHSWKPFQSKTVEFELSYDLSAPGETQRINLVTLIPQSIPDRQTISSISYSPKPSKIFNRYGNRYAVFVFVKPKRHTEIKINVKAELFRYDLMTARTKGQKTPASDLELVEFMKQERYLEKDNDIIRQVADGIEGESDIDLVKNIYEYVAENMEYAVSWSRGLGAVRALQRGKGDCTEYSDLFVAICRAKNIPARVISGYTVRTDSKPPGHNWVEVYLRGYGWVPFDPTSGDIENVLMRGRAFSRLWPVYIYLSHVRNDDVLGRYGFASYRYWGDRVRIKESVEFK